MGISVRLSQGQVYKEKGTPNLIIERSCKNKMMCFRLQWWSLWWNLGSPTCYLKTVRGSYFERGRVSFPLGKQLREWSQSPAYKPAMLRSPPKQRIKGCTNSRRALLKLPCEDRHKRPKIRTLTGFTWGRQVH